MYRVDKIIMELREEIERTEEYEKIELDFRLNENNRNNLTSCSSQCQWLIMFLVNSS